MGGERATLKLYLDTEREYLEIVKTESFFDKEAEYGYLLPYSEFQKPYFETGQDEGYPWWEWNWIDPIWFPPWPPVSPEPHPCVADERCTWALVFGPGTLDVNDYGTYTQAHVWIGCTIAPWWAAYGGWTLDKGNTEAEIVFSGPIMATVDAGSVAGTFTITYNGPGCSNSMSVEVLDEEECCAEFTLTGDDTVNQGDTWTGTISPACPTAECSVSSNSGCSLTCTVNAAGSQVTVGTTGACGSFTVTVTDQARDGECSETSDTQSVRIIGGGGSFSSVEVQSSENCSENCTVGCGSAFSDNCWDEDNAYYYGWQSSSPCDSSYSAECAGCQVDECPSMETNKPPCRTATATCDSIGRTSGFCSGSGDDTKCPCTKWSWQKCEWVCSC